MTQLTSEKKSDFFFFFDLAVWKFQHFNLVAKYLKNCLSHCLETWQADKEWRVNDLINLRQLTQVSIVVHGPLVRTSMVKSRGVQIFWVNTV